MNCPACGALPRYIIQGTCRTCGHATDVPLTENREVTL